MVEMGSWRRPLCRRSKRWSGPVFWGCCCGICKRPDFVSGGGIEEERRRIGVLRLRKRSQSMRKSGRLKENNMSKTYRGPGGIAIPATGMIKIPRTKRVGDEARWG